MKVIKTGGAEVTLGTAQAAPTISMTDYSRRVTDDFGVTTVVKRGFARKMAVRFALPFDDVSRVQSELAGLRGSAARWEVDADVDWLNFEGFYKDFDIDHAVPPLSFCSLTVEGLAEVEPGTDDGSDPAADGASTLLVLQPVEITGFTSNNVPENDYSEWSAGVSYAMGSRVIKAATHRIYESAGGGNVGNDPAGASGLWIDIGPTNRWAMLDKALGTATAQASNIILSISPGDVSAIALLDVVATSVRVQKSGYDQTRSASDGSVNFFDLPTGSGSITITISGSGTVSVGTMLVGNLTGLGNSGEAPTAGITDYSRKEVDAFGDTTIVERAWAKRMATKALIKNASVDKVCNRIAALRGAPVLWMADEGTDSLSVYGFFKDFSIEVGESVSTLSLSIEGLSKAAPIGSTITAEIQAALDILAAATGKVTYGGPLPSAANSSVGDLHVGDDGRVYIRVSATGILLGGKVIVLGGFRPVIAWTLASSQPIAAGIRYGLQAIDEAQAAQASADLANAAIADIDDDAIITISEKVETLIPGAAAFEALYTAVAANAAVAGVAITTLDAKRTAWLAALAAISPAWNDVSQASPVTRNALDTARNEYDAELKETQRHAIEAMTAAQQVVIVPPVPQIVYRDWQGNIKSGQYNRTLVPKVERGGVDIRVYDDVTYAISTTGSIAATVNNTTASADKGKITATDGSSGSIILTVTVAGVSFPTFTIPFTNQDDNPPTTGGGSGNTGGSDSTLEDVTSASFATITQQDGGESVFLIDITSGQTLNGTAPLTYQKSGSNTTATALTGKWQYRLQGDPTWLDFTGSAITGTGAYWNDVDFSAETGDATVNQSKASLATGTYEVQLVAAKSNSAAGNLQIISGTATVSRS